MVIFRGISPSTPRTSHHQQQVIECRDEFDTCTLGATEICASLHRDRSYSGSRSVAIRIEIVASRYIWDVGRLERGGSGVYPDFLAPARKCPEA